jgi:uncharacterized membrane protein YraQ (UPF0718 family)
MQKADLKKAGKKLLNNLNNSIPILLGVLLLVGLVKTLIPNDFFQRVFTGNMIVDPVMGALIGSVAGGNPLTSYVIGGELLDKGTSLVAVLAFIVSWVTVGIIQLPAESLMLGRRFAFVRNALSFVFAIVIALVTVFIMGVL